MPDGRGVRRGAWPAHPVIYQVYPRSFADTTGSGEGDLNGIAARLDHIRDLGADAVWIGPVYPSPMFDGGYDVADYTGIAPRFGTLEDLDRVIARARALGLRVMMDLVFNHTSVAHPWFEASAARRDGKDDWFVWADAGPEGGLPNNWQSYFGPPAWTWHAGRGQYYYHTFSDQQPKLNLRHAAVRAALGEVCAFWRACGVEGFRMDAVTSYLHDPELRDNPPARPEVAERIAGPPEGTYTKQDHLYDFLPGDGVEFMAEVREWVGPDVYLIGEVNSGNGSVELASDLVGPDGLDSAYVVDLAERGVTGGVLADMVERGACREGLAWWLSTHDQPRHISRAGDGSARDARLFAALLLGLPGPTILYQGEELGQRQGDLPREAVHDPFDLRFWPDAPGREAARVPLAWTGEAPGYGFTTGTPWLPMETAGAPHPVSEQEGVCGSVLSFYRRVLEMRRRLDLADGSTEVLDADESWFVARIHPLEDGPATMVAVNLGSESREIPGETPLTRLLCSAEDRSLPARVLPRRSAAWFREGRGRGA